MKEGADPRDKEDGADEVTLGQGIVLQAKCFGKDERDGNETSKGSQVVLKVGKRQGRQGFLLIQYDNTGNTVFLLMASTVGNNFPRELWTLSCLLSARYAIKAFLLHQTRGAPRRREW